jgi:hypothetical protein
MVTLCGGAATTRSPRPRLEMLATQCPRLRRLSGRAAALSFHVWWASPTFPDLGIPRGDDPPYPPQRASPARRGVGSLNPLRLLGPNVACDRRLPGSRPHAAHDRDICCIHDAPRTPRLSRPQGLPCPRASGTPTSRARPASPTSRAPRRLLRPPSPSGPHRFHAGLSATPSTRKRDLSATPSTPLSGELCGETVVPTTEMTYSLPRPAPSPLPPGLATMYVRR